MCLLCLQRHDRCNCWSEVVVKECNNVVQRSSIESYEKFPCDITEQSVTLIQLN